MRPSTDSTKTLLGRRLRTPALLLLCLFWVLPGFAQSIDFAPSSLVLAPGESGLVAINLSNPGTDALSGYQITLSFDPATLRVINPNEALRGTVPPFAPLGGSALCTTVRGVAPCPDPSWLLTDTGRAAMQGPEVIDNIAGTVQIVYGTQGSTAPAGGGGTVALLEVVALQQGSATITIVESVLANDLDLPAPITHGRTAFAVTVTAGNGNLPPTLNTIGNQGVAEASTLNIPLSASDPDGDALSFSANGLPTFVVLTDNGDGTAVLVATPGFLDAGAYPITVSVSDGQLTDEELITLTVANVNRPPTLASPGDQSSDEGDTVNVNLTGSDVDGDVLTYAATGLPPGTSIAPASGIISGTLGFDSAGLYTVQASASDGIDTSIVNFNWTVNDINRPPVLNSPGNQTSSEGDAVNLALTASDADGDALSYSAVGLPPGLGIDTTTGAITGTLGFDAAGSYSVQASANDGTDTATVNFSWTVNELNQAPTLASPGAQISDEGDTINLVLAGNDADGDALTYAATGLPSALVIDSLTGTITGTLDFDSAGDYSVQASVSDGTDTANINFTWTVNELNQAPTLTSPGDQTNDEGDSISLTLAGADADGDTLTYTATGLPPGLSTGATTGLISGTLDFDAAGVYAVQASAGDGTDTTSVSFNWTVNNLNQAPTLASPGDQTSDEGDAVNLLLAGGDADGDVLNYSATGLPPGLGVDAASGAISGTLGFDTAGSFVVQASVSDGTDSASVSFNWTVIEINRAPVLNSPGDQTNNEGDAVNVALIATDADGDGLTYAATGLPPGIGIDTATGAITGTIGFDAAGSYAVLASASDGIDTVNVSFNWNVTDINRAPVLVSPGSQSNNEGDSVNLLLSGSDADGDTLVYSVVGLPSGLNVASTTGVISGTLGFDTAGSYAVRASVSDGTDSVDVDFNWSVTDVNQAPTLASPGDQSNDEGDTVSLALGGGDADGDTLSYSATGLPPGLLISTTTGVISGTLGFDSAGSYLVQASVSDLTESVSVNFNWTVADQNRPPLLNAPADQINSEGDSVSVALIGSDPDGDILNYSASGLPPGLGVATATGVISGTLDFDSAGSYLVQANVSDGTESVSVNFAWTVNDLNRAPTIASPGDQNSNEGDVVSLVLVGSDADGDALAYSVSGLPPGLGIDSVSGAISGTLSFDTAGSYAVQASASDGAETATVNFNWTVADQNRAPTIASPGNQQSDEGEIVSLAVVASDADGDTLSFGATGLPPGLGIDTASGLISGTLDFSSAGTFNVTLSVSDGDLSANVGFIWTVGGVNQAPILTSPGDQANDEGDAIGISLIGSDADGDTLTFSAIGLPPGLGVDAASGAISGTLGFDAAGAYAVQASVTDGTDTSNASFNWTVTNVNQAPVLTSPGDQSSTEGDTVNLSIIATDADGEALTYSAIGLPAGLGIGTTSGTISGALGFDSAGSFAVQVSVSDGTDTVSVDFNWTVVEQNQPPTLASPGNQLNDEGDIVNVSLTASDADGDALTYSAAGLPPGLSVNLSTGIIIGTLGFDSAGSYAVQASVSDGIDVANASFTWTVNDVNRAPVLASPGDQTNNEGDSVNLTLTATDTDDDVLTYTATGLPTGLSMNATTGAIAGSLGFDTAGSYAVQVSVSDGAEAATVNFNWTVNEQNQAPTVTSPGDQTSEEGATVNLAISGNDADGDTLTFSATGLPPGLGIAATTGIVSGSLDFDSAGSYNVQVSASDGTDTTSVNFNWLVTAVNQAPVISSPGDQSSAEGETIDLALVGSDADGDILTYSITGLPPGLSLNISSGAITGTLGFDSAGGYTVQASVSDGTDSSSVSFNWTVTEVNQPPELASPGDQSNDEGDVVTLSLSASDADGDTLAYSATGLPGGLVIDSVSGTISGSLSFDVAGSYSVQASVSDGSDTASVNFNWIVSDINRPPVIGSPGPQQDDEGDVVNLALTASDDDGDTLTYSATGLPPGLVINSVTGIVSGTLGFDAAGSYNVNVSVSDGNVSASTAFVWTVGGVNRSPTIAALADQLNDEGDVVNLAVIANDPDGDTLNFAATGLPPGLVIDSGSGVITGSLAFDAAGNYVAQINVSDGTDTVSADVGWTVANVNQPPTVATPADQTNNENDTVSLTLSADDADGDSLTFSASGLPAGLSIDPASGVISGELATGSAGSYAVSVTASDADTGTTVTFSWLVNSGNSAPVLTSPGAQTSAEGESVNLQVIASDADGDALVFTATGLPTGLTIDAASGLISGSLDFTAAGTFNSTVNVSDGSESDSATFSWLVSNTNREPTLDVPPDQLNDEGDGVSVTLTASDADGDSLTYSAVGMPPGVSVDPDSGTLTGTLGFDSAGTYSVIASAGDGTVSVSVGFGWVVNDVNRTPVVSTIPDQSSEVAELVSISVVATDDDGDNLTFGATGLPPGLGISPSSGTISGTVADAVGAYSVTVTASDGTDVGSTAFQWQIVAASNAAPIVVNPGNQSSLEGDSVGLSIDASDADGDTLVYSATGLPTGLAIDSSTGVIAGTILPSSAAIYDVQVDVSDSIATTSINFSWTVDPQGTVLTLSIPIARGADDAVERSDTSMVVRAGKLDLVERADGTSLLVALRFRNVHVAAGSTIRAANVRFTARAPGSGIADLVIGGEATGNSPPILREVENLSLRTQTDASIDWWVAEWVAIGDTGAAQTTPDISAVIQEIVSRSDWVSGNKLTIFISGIGRRVAESHNTLESAAPVLYLEFEEPPPNTPPELQNPGDQLSRIGEAVNLPVIATDANGDALTFASEGLPPGITLDSATGVISGTVVSGSVGDYLVTIKVYDGNSSVEARFMWAIRPSRGFAETITLSVARGRDDAEERLDTNVVRRSGPLDLAETGAGTQQLVGLRFRSAAVPTDAVIRSAYLQFTATGATSGATNLIISGEAASVPRRFGAGDGNLTSRAQTTATVSWSPPDWLLAGDAGSAQQSADISTVIQELLLLPRTVIEQDFILFIRGDGRRVAHSFNTSAASAPQLVIEYEIP